MDLLEFVPFFSVLLLAALGLGSLALSLTVWRRRRHAMQARSPRARALSRLLIPLGLLGSIVIILSLSLRTFFPRQGELFVRDSIVVRADTQRGMPSLSPEEELETGALLATFSRPGLAAELRRLRLEEKRLATEAGRLREAPLRLDPVLVREHQELVAERRHLLQRRDLFRVEQQRLEQQGRTELLEKRIQRHEIHVQLEDYAGRISKLESEIAFEKLRLKSAQGMHDKDALSEISFAERRRNIEVVEADHARLRKEQADKRALLDELSRGIETLVKTLQKHERLVTARSDEVGAALLARDTRQRRLEERREKDWKRVRRARAAELSELELRRQECGQQLTKLEDEARVLCPRPGRVLYRHPSPQSADLGEPLVLFGPRSAVRARFRLAKREADRLSAAGTVELFATSHELLECRLVGRVVTQVPLEHEPGMVVAELECDSTPTQLAYLARGLTLDARLLWAPPLASDPLLLLGALLVLLSLLPSIGWRLRRGSSQVITLPRSPARVEVKAPRARSG